MCDMNICFHFLHQREIYRDIIKLFKFLCSVPESFADLNRTRKFSEYFNETLRHKTKQKLVQRKWRCFMLTDG